MKPVEQPDGSLLINCTTSIMQIVLRMFKNTPSCQIAIKCNQCLQEDLKDVIAPFLYMADIKSGLLDLTTLSNLSMKSRCQTLACNGYRETSIASTGDMVIFEIFNADENQVVKLNSLPKGFENPINADEKYRLVGVVDLTQRATRRRSHENINSEVGTMGHFTAICLRGTEWWEYDDTQDQPRMKKGSAYVNAQILVYVRE
ncbi:Protein of unknown function [Cotesia congregata]|uniref:Uncharacterized protein n=1 Tax=Cotesia congregata TaxID=51543 RepID=A0A8J2HI88_COTCN|nr:Protein of unknown function [Cotesia congregata]